MPVTEVIKWANEQLYSQLWSTALPCCCLCVVSQQQKQLSWLHTTSFVVICCIFKILWFSNVFENRSSCSSRESKRTLSVSTLVAHPAVFETWTGLSQLCPEPGGSPWNSTHVPGQRFEGRIWGDRTCHMHCKNTVFLQSCRRLL